MVNYWVTGFIASLLLFVSVLPLMAGRDVNQLPVVQHGALVGVVSRDALVQYLEVRRSLGVETTKSDTQNWLRHAT